MQLKLKRSQRQGGVMGGKLLFCLDARVEFTGEERSNITKYKLGSTIIYNSEASKKHLEAGMAAVSTGSVGGLAKSAFSFAMSRLNLNISIDGLANGTHVECKDMEELLGAEEAVINACQNLKAFLQAASTFDGREVLIDFANDEPKVAAPGLASLAPPPAPPPSLAASMPQSAMSPPGPISTPTPAPALAMAMPSGPMMADRTSSDQLPPIDKFKEWWGALTLGQQVGFVAGGFFALYLLIAIL